jgi:YjbE family integral membrane protein
MSSSRARIRAPALQASVPRKRDLCRASVTVFFFAVMLLDESFSNFQELPTVELLSTEFLTALMAIIVIDLVLAGDNAIVIALAARSLPPDLRRKTILWGTAGAIIVRAVLTLFAVWLLKIPGFLLAGGLALVWIAYKLLAPADTAHEHGPSASNLLQAMQTIVIADAVMGVDNVLAVAGAAHGSFLLVVLGLLISIPIVVWGSQLILKWVDRYPVIIYIGAGVLAWTAGKMITNEPFLKAFFAQHESLKLVLLLLVMSVVLVPGYLRGPGGAHANIVIGGSILLVWLTFFNWFEHYVHMELHPDDKWEWQYQIIDLIMWVGWVPLVLWAVRRYGSGPRGAAQATGAAHKP